MIEHIQAVIFDIDGTLVDSNGMWGEIDEEYFKVLEIPMPPTIQKDIAGMSFTEVAIYFKETFHIDDKSIDDIKLDWVRMAFEKYLYEVQAKPGAKEYMRFLKDKGIRIGCATSNEKRLAEAALTPHGFINKVDVVRTACEVAKGKPAPDIYLKVAEELGVEPKNCLVFEDIPNGVKAGKAAGMTVIAVKDKASLNETDEIKELADEYIENFYDVLEGRVEIKYEFSSGK